MVRILDGRSENFEREGEQNFFLVQTCRLCQCKQMH